MDLIYTDKNNVELGILQDYQLDLAFGTSENDFELKLALDNNVLDIGCQFYFEGTEYGGIVDAISIDTEKNEITYSGRTWHGILAGKIVAPTGYADYVLVSGEPNDVLKRLIKMCDLEDMFVVLADSTGDYINNITVIYQDLYTCICRVLSTVNKRLKIYRIGRQVCLEAVPLINYANSEEWDAAEKSFRATHRAAKTNHLVMLGGYTSGNTRIKIDLYADENGSLQEYSAITGEPYDTSQYITDNRNQVLFGKDEITEVVENNNAGVTYNYVRLSTCPADFSTHFSDYFYWEEGNYKNLESERREELVFLTDEPKRWDKQYMNYFTTDGNPVEGVVTAEYYEKLPKGPVPTVKDWKKNYSKYYYLKTDGHSEPVWTQVEGVDVRDYVEQTIRPSDWSTNWKNAYIFWLKMESVQKEKYLDSEGKERERTVPFEKNRFYKRTEAGNYVLLTKKPDKWETESTRFYAPTVSEFVKADTRYATMPTWKKVTFYDLMTVGEQAPVWDELVQYGIKHPETVTAPTFRANTYKKKVTNIYKPVWIPDTYYALHEDRYAKLVEAGKQKFDSYRNNDSVDMTLPADKYEYFVGGYCWSFRRCS